MKGNLSLQIINKLSAIAASAFYWSALLVLGLFMEALALYYQYALDYLPCVLCIHVRILILGFIVVAIIVLFRRHSWRLRAVAHVVNTGIMLWLLERSWMTLGSERLTIVANCSMNSGLPSWFALDKWFPVIFEVHEPCGYTPELLFGITMAEALVPLSVALVAVSTVLTVAAIIRR